MSTHRGKLIVFEGLDRSGKSTQATKLVDYLQEQGRNVLHLRFPNRTTPIGQMINSYLSGQSQQEDHVIHLLFSANRWEAAQDIEDAVARGTDVVVDRYYYSGAVYSAAKNNPSLSLEWCRQQEVGLPRPDVCLFLDLTTEEAAKRGGYGTERYEKEEMQARVRGLFEEMREHTDEKEDITVIDAGQSIGDVQASIRSTVKAVIAHVDHNKATLRRVNPW